MNAWEFLLITGAICLVLTTITITNYNYSCLLL